MSRAVKISAAVAVVALLVAMAAVALAIASIGGEDDSPSASSGDQPARQFPEDRLPEGGPPGGVDQEALVGVDQEALQAFRDCLADQGVELPEPGGQGGEPPSGFDPNSSDLQQAFSACQDQ